MRVVHVLRKPLSEGTVAANTLKHGTGGVNIDASRITTTDNLDGGAYTQGRKPREMHPGGVDTWKDHWEDKERKYVPPTGRWPANVILQHLDGCRCDGIKQVKGIGGGDHSGTTETHEQVGGFGYDRHNITRHNDADGKETVANWICEPGCPVVALDEQSGVSKSTGGRIGNKDGAYGKLGISGFTKEYEKGDPGFGDVGGASRFYKQIGGSSE